MKKLIIVMITVLLCAYAKSTLAQFNVGKRIENKTINRANQRTDQAIDKGLDGIEKGIKGDGKKKDKDQTPENKTDKKAGQNTEVTSKTDQEQQDQPSLQAFSKYDFIPGERVIFFDDFSQDAVGDFPALWTANAPGEINTLSVAPGNWFNLNNGEGNYFYLKNVDFPKNFII
jgi:OmpA-OmpF porin, OOP family